jgi:Leucine-rich repeat (LRR) protein
MKRQALAMVANVFSLFVLYTLATTPAAARDGDDAILAYDDASLAQLPADTTKLQIFKLDDRCMPRVGKLTRLQSFSAANTIITDRGAKELAALTDLVRLELSWSFVTEELAAPLSKLRNLREIELRDTRTGDRVCQSLSEHCPDLRVCLLDKTAVTEVGLGHLAKLKKLERLNVSLCKIDDQVAVAIGQMTRLRELSLGATAIGDNTYAAILKLPDLQELSIQESKVNSAAVAAGGVHPTVRKLSFSFSDCDDAAAAQLAKWPKLQELDLARTAVTDKCIPALVAMKTVRRLDLRGSQVTAKGLEQLKAARPDIKFVQDQELF